MPLFPTGGFVTGGFSNMTDFFKPSPDPQPAYAARQNNDVKISLKHVEIENRQAMFFTMVAMFSPLAPALQARKARN
jgi:hypothetical protein